MADSLEKQRVQDRELRMAALEEAKKKSPAEEQAEKDRAAYFQWRDKGDFRTPPPSLIGLTYGPEAARRREMEQTAAPMGAMGMGAAYADPTAMALAKQNLNDENAEQDANAYQDEIRAEDTYQRSGNAESLMARDFARRMGLLSEASGMSQFSTNARIQAQPQPILPMLLSGLIAGAGQVGAAYVSGGMSGGKKP